jgi:putative FmdB family regulatory protein
MPMFEYHCEQCQTAFEQLVPFQQADDVACPSCQQPHVHRKFSRVAFHVQGGGTSSSADWSSENDTCSTGSCCAGGSCNLI